MDMMADLLSRGRPPKGGAVRRQSRLKEMLGEGEGLGKGSGRRRGCILRVVTEAGGCVKIEEGLKEGRGICSGPCLRSDTYLGVRFWPATGPSRPWNISCRLAHRKSKRYHVVMEAPSARASPAAAAAAGGRVASTHPRALHVYTRGRYGQFAWRRKGSSPRRNPTTPSDHRA